MELSSSGNLGEEKAFFKYNPGGNDGALEIFCGGSQLIIRDQDVVAVVRNTKSSNIESDENEAQLHQIFCATNIVDSVSTATKRTVKFTSLQAKNLPKQYTKLHCVPIRPPSLSVPPYRDGTPNLHVIISVRAGIGEAQSFFDDVLKELLDLSGLEKKSYTVHVTDSEKFVSKLTNTIFLPRANEGFAQTIILLSGDGGVVDIVNELLSFPQSEPYIKPTIGILALGTGNALANSIGLRHGHDRGLRSLFNGKPHVLPTFTAFFSPESTFLVDEGKNHEPLPMSDKNHGVVYGAVVCSWALHASLVADSDTTEYRKYGNERFTMAAQELLFPSDGSVPHVYSGKITLIDSDRYGNEVSRMIPTHEHKYLLASLVSNLEENFKVSPYSKPLDGQLRLLHLGAIPSAEVTKIMGLAFAGGLHVNEEGVMYENIDGFRIDFEEAESRWRRVCIDGKIVEVNAGGWLELRKEKRLVVNILVDSSS